MASAEEHDEDDAYDQAWWEASFAERQAAIESVYGRSHPPGSPQGYVTSFTWEGVLIPGGCCLTCPPTTDDMPPADAHADWAYATLGLTQPLTAKEAEALRDADPRTTGYGSEFAMCLVEPAEWPARVLRQLMWYVRAHAPINAGDRMPFGAERTPEGTVDANIGDQEAEGVVLLGSMRALLFWPNLRNRSSFTTSTGTFDVLVATAISGAEWEFAQALSSEHLLLLLYRCGIGQRSDLTRDDVVTGHRWGEDVRLVQSMDHARVAEELAAFRQTRGGWRKRD